MRKSCYLILLLCSWLISSNAEEMYFEGIGGHIREPLFKNLMGMAVGYLPYNPVIVEAGDCTGENSRLMAQIYPKGRIFIFEPNPTAFQELSAKMRSFGNATVYNQTLGTRGEMTLDSWCQSNQIQRVDLIRLDVGDLGLKILMFSPQITKSAAIVFTKTDLRPLGKNLTRFQGLRKHLEAAGFRLLAHCYQKDADGEALFLRNDIYRAIYER